MELISYFDRITLINLKRRPDRLERFREQQAAHWPLGEVVVFPAIDGDRVGVPKDCTQGGGAFGCRQSHVAVLEQALTDDVQRLLVFEDDAEWKPTFGERLQTFLEAVPSDWEQLMIGGQHHRGAVKISAQVVRVTGSQRTHCYAIRPPAMRALLNLWRSCTVHIDWTMADWHRWNDKVFAPHEFLVGQREGKSDISGRKNGSQWWNPPSEDIPVILLRAERSTVEELQKIGWHIGYWCDPVTGQDNGLRSLVLLSDPIPELRKTVRVLRTEADSIPNGRAVLWHEKITLAMLKEADIKAIEVSANTVEQALEAIK